MSYVPECVVAADGGNSKTDLVLATVQGDVLARVQGSGTRPQVHGFDGTAQALRELTRCAIEQAGAELDSPFAAGAFYLANVDQPEHEDAARTALHGVGLARQISVHNDTFAVLRAGTTRDWGVAVVAGAGINAVGVDPHGRAERFLSLGDISGDWGGGEDVGAAGLGAAVRAADGRGPQTALRERITEVFRESPEAVAIALDANRLERGGLHRLAPVVFRTATDGDEVARGIVIRLADEVVLFVATLLRRLILLDSDADVVLGGGLLQSGNRILLERIVEQVTSAAPHVHVQVLDVPPVVGALTDALTAAGATADSIRRARSADLVSRPLPQAPTN